MKMGFGSLDTHLWKHNLPSYFVAGGNNKKCQERNRKSRYTEPHLVY